MTTTRNTTSKSIRAFTLFEMLIVIALIGVAIGGLSWNLPKLLKKERFEGNVQKVCSKLALAQEIMIDYDTDVIVTFEPTEKGSLCRISPQGHFPKKHLSQINKEGILDGIEQITFNNQTDGGIVALHFVSSMGKTPEGVLVLNGSREVKLFLPGYPSRITPKRAQEVSINAAPYPQEILPSA